MDIEEFEAQLNELDTIAMSSGVNVSFDKTTSSIVATKRVYPSLEERWGNVKIGSSHRYSTESSGGVSSGSGEPMTSSESLDDLETTREPNTATTREPATEHDGEDLDLGYEPVAPAPKEMEVRSVAEIKLTDVEVPDEFIDERMRLAFNRRRAGYLPDVKLVGFGASGVWEVAEDYSYPIDYFAVGREMTDEARRHFESMSHAAYERRVPTLATITARKGFQFDRASIPRIFWVIISKDDLSNVPPLFHDLLYRFGGILPKECVSPFTEFTRAEADYLFYHLMERSGVTSWRLHIAYQAVSQFSSFAWGKALIR